MPLRFLRIGTILLSAWIVSCGGHSPNPISETPKPVSLRRVLLNLDLGRVGVLGRAQQMIPTRLYLRFQSNASILRDTILLGGSSKVSKEYELPLAPETLYVEGHDQRDSVLYRGSAIFAVQDTGVTPVAISLDARFASLALSIPAIDSMTRLVVKVDGTLWTDSSLSDTLGRGDVVTLQRDYVPASPLGVAHSLSLAVHGIYQGKDTILFALDTSLGVASIANASAVLPLHWVGPPRSGRVSLSVGLGTIGQLDIRFVYDTSMISAPDDSLGRTSRLLPTSEERSDLPSGGTHRPTTMAIRSSTPPERSRT